MRLSKKVKKLLGNKPSNEWVKLPIKLRKKIVKKAIKKYSGKYLK